MKRLILINGTMGSGKTAVSKELCHLIRPGVFLDGDWCWSAQPFTVTEETKEMVLKNISFLLKNFLTCSAYENVLFCWVMHKEEIVQELLSRLDGVPFQLFRFTLMPGEAALRERLLGDVAEGIRSADVISRSMERLPLYREMDSIKIDVSHISAKEAAAEISGRIFGN